MDNSFSLGGEDGHVRLWSIKSGEMLFDAEVTDSALSNVHWSRVEGTSCAYFFSLGQVCTNCNSVKVSTCEMSVNVNIND